jgi:hypothetical protein
VKEEEVQELYMKGWKGKSRERGGNGGKEKGRKEEG